MGIEMNHKLASLLRTLENSPYLCAGIITAFIGFLLRFFPLIILYGIVDLPSIAGIVAMIFGLFLVVVGAIDVFTDRMSSKRTDGRRIVTLKNLERRFSQCNLPYSSDRVQVLSKLGETIEPLNRKQIAERTGISNGRLSEVLKELAEKGCTIEFQTRGKTYCDLSRRGLMLAQDIAAAAQEPQIMQTIPAVPKLKASRFSKEKSKPYGMSAPSRGKLTRAIARQQTILIFSFIGGIFTCFAVTIETPLTRILVEISHFTMTPLLMTLAWLTATIICAYKTTHTLGVTSVALAWASGLLTFRGETLMILGISFLISSATIEFFDALYSQPTLTSPRTTNVT